MPDKKPTPAEQIRKAIDAQSTPLDSLADPQLLSKKLVSQVENPDSLLSKTIRKTGITGAIEKTVHHLVNRGKKDISPKGEHLKPGDRGINQ